VQKANSGHPGAPMGLAPVAHTLFNKVMNFNPKNPKWINRDRFVLSNGHACALQYTMLHLCGYDLSLDDLKNFRQLHSKTPGHPECFKTPGVEVSTGPLGQGIANAVGMAIAQTHLAGVFNKPGYNLFDHYIYTVCGDGCLQEGVALEAISLAGHYKLGRLIVLYDDNKIQIDGSTELAFTEDVAAKFAAQNWHVLHVERGDSDVDGILAAIEQAKAVTDKPSIIVVKTTIGFGSKKQGTEEVHGSPLGPKDLAEVKKLFGFDPEQSFIISDAVRQAYAHIPSKGEGLEAKWNAMFAEYEAKFPQEAAELRRRLERKFPEDIFASLPSFAVGSKKLATREASGLVLNALAVKLPELIGGSADLTPSNKTWLECSTNFSPEHPAGRYLRFGVREHAMIAIGNGISAYGCLIPFTATFLNFIEYGFGAARLSALSGHQQLFIMTHDSIGLGEDGPTHQPVEAVALLRATPNCLTFRPADSNEVAGAYACALQFKSGPSVLCLSRQGLPVLEGTSAKNVLKGAYTVVKHQGPEDAKRPDLVLIGTGSELEVAYNAAAAIAEKKEFKSVSVVSAPCLELFARQSLEERLKVLPRGALIVSVEALATNGWDRYSHYAVGMTTFGESAPTAALYKEFGFTAENVVAKVEEHYARLSEAVGSATVMPPVPIQLLPPISIAESVREW